jgi:hypothetical protein
VDRLHFKRNDDGSFNIDAVVNGEKKNVGNNIAENKLSDHIGKEPANKILKKFENYKGDETEGSLEKPDLKIGGEGMKGFYDHIIPKAIEKLGKEHGVKVKQSFLRTAEDNKLAKKLEENGYDPENVNLQNILEDSGGRLPFWLNDAEATAIENGEHLDFKGTKKQPIHYIDLPQSLKDTALKKGFPLFATGGIPLIPVDNPFKKKDNK